MGTEQIRVNGIEFDIVTEKVTQVEVSSSLFELLEKEDEMGFYNTHRTSWSITELLKEIEDIGLEEYASISNQDLDLLRACKCLLDNHKVDAIEFIGE